MTLKELYKKVCSLSFDSSPMLDEVFVNVTEQALESIYSSLKIKGETRLYVMGDAPSTRIGEFHHKGGGVETLPLVGRAYSMRLFGEGTIIINDGEENRRMRFSCQGDRVSGFLKKNGYLILEGAFSYKVCDIVTYSEVYSSRHEDIHDGSGIRRIDVRSAVSDFKSFYTPPTDNSGRTIPAEMRDGELIFSSDYSGMINLTYIKRPTGLILEESELPLELPEEYCYALAYLVTSLLNSEENPEVSEHYKRLYEGELLGIASSKAYDLTRTEIKTNGWA